MPALNINLILMHALTLAFALLYQIPDWPEISYNLYDRPMVDRHVYETKILSYDLPVDYIFDFDILMYFTTEWLWNSSLAYLNRDLDLSTDQIFFLITTFVLWRFTFAVASRVGWMYVILLLNPLVIDFAFSQLRLALAISILTLFWKGQHGRSLTILAYMVCASIHTGTILFAVAHFAANAFAAPTRRNLVVLCLTGVMLALAIGPLREVILGAIEDRRAGYSDMSSTLAYLSFWILLWALFLCTWKESMISIDGRYALIILSLVATNLFTGGYSTRFIAAAFPSLVIAMSRWPGRPVNFIPPLFVLYAGLQWLYWLRVL